MFKFWGPGHYGGGGKIVRINYDTENIVVTVDGCRDHGYKIDQLEKEDPEIIKEREEKERLAREQEEKEERERQEKKRLEDEKRKEVELELEKEGLKVYSRIEVIAGDFKGSAGYIENIIADDKKVRIITDFDDSMITCSLDEIQKEDLSANFNRKRNFVTIVDRKTKTDGKEALDIYKIGQRVGLRSGLSGIREDVKKSSTLTIVGFDGNEVLTMLDSGKVICDHIESHKKLFYLLEPGVVPVAEEKGKEKAESRPEIKRVEAKEGEARIFVAFDGGTVQSDGRLEYGGLRVGTLLKTKAGADLREVVLQAKKLELVGFTSDNKYIIRIDDNKVVTGDYYLGKGFGRYDILEPSSSSTTSSTEKEGAVEKGEAKEAKQFLTEVFDYIANNASSYGGEDWIRWKWRISEDGKFVDMQIGNANERAEGYQISKKMDYFAPVYLDPQVGIDLLVEKLKGKKVISVNNNGSWFLEVIS